MTDCSKCGIKDCENRASSMFTVTCGDEYADLLVCTPHYAKGMESAMELVDECRSNGMEADWRSV